MVQMFSCTRANLKYQHKHVKENKSCARFKIWLSKYVFKKKKEEFPYTAAIVSINRCFSLSNDDGDVNKNVTKATGLDWQNNNFARASRFYVHFFSLLSLHDYDVKLPNFTFFEGREHRTTTFYLFSWTSIQPQKKLPTFDEMNEME